MISKLNSLSLHWKVLIGIFLGLILGYICRGQESGTTLIQNYIKPFGTIFINLLKLIAVPLVFASLAKGILDLKDIKRLSKIGGKTIFWYLTTTLFAVLLGLILVNAFQPGVGVEFGDSNLQIEPIVLSDDKSDSSPLDFFVRMVPDNIFAALSDNGRLLQVIFFTIFFSISLLITEAKWKIPLENFITSLNAIILKMVDLIIAFSPYAVLALMASLMVEVQDTSLFGALIKYALVLLGGMLIMLILYPVLIRVITGMPIKKFVRGILPAQLVALSTSSSMATLPVTMECVTDNLDVDPKIASFVCPIGATVNMDATSLMQSIAAVFACQMMGFDLSFAAQATIVLTATLASIGAAAAPSAGIVMLVMVLESIGFPGDKLPVVIAMILAIDRPLDMWRTVVNISGDSFVSVIVDRTTKQ